MTSANCSWYNRFAPYLEIELLSNMIKWSIKKIQNMYSKAYESYLGPTKKFLKTYTKTLTQFKKIIGINSSYILKTTEDLRKIYFGIFCLYHVLQNSNSVIKYKSK